MRRLLLIVGIVALAFLLVYAAGCKQKTQQAPAGQPPGGMPSGGAPAESTGAKPDTSGGMTKGSGDPAAKGDVALAKDVQPLFTKKCANASCHGAAKSAGMQLSEGMAYANIVSVASSENPKLMRVAPGAPDDSWLVMKLEGKQTFGARMPLSGGYLSDAQIQMIRQWIQAGAKNN